MEQNMSKNFKDKVAFVTGAGSGIGRTAAVAFAREGANVAVTDIDEKGNQETARLIEELGARSLAVRCDVAQTVDIQAALDKTIEVFGRLDFAFNMVGKLFSDSLQATGVQKCRCAN